MVERHAETPAQALDPPRRHADAEGIGEAVRVDRAIVQLCLRRQRPVRVKLDALAGLQRQRIAKSVDAVGKAPAGDARTEVAVIPGRPRLAVDTKSRSR